MDEVADYTDCERRLRKAEVSTIILDMTTLDKKKDPIGGFVGSDSLYSHYGPFTAPKMMKVNISRALTSICDL